MQQYLAQIISNIVTENVPLTVDEAHYLASDEIDFWAFLYGANMLRQYFRGDIISLCSLINARSGDCTEDCKFCAQSAHHSTGSDNYPLVDGSEIEQAYQRTKKIGTHGFSIVTSGNELSSQEIDKICAAARNITNTASFNPYLCGSLGKLTLEQANKLKQAGFVKCHHNLETSRNFFPKVCTTHSYEERLETIKNIKNSGLRVCSGGIFGMGETWTDRIELAFALKELDVSSIPLNFLIPIKGTALEKEKHLEPTEALKITALFRYIMPDKDIKICGGREKILRDIQSWIFYAGASGMMIGGYLTQPGRPVEDDLQMIKDLRLTTKHGDSANSN